MSLASPILQTTLAGRKPDRQGKVRDIFDFGDRLLIVASDRISAFDYVLGSGIPDKGKVLSQISAFWFDRTRSIVRNHVLSTDPADFALDSLGLSPAEARSAADMLRGRSMLVTRTDSTSLVPTLTRVGTREASISGMSTTSVRGSGL